MANANDRNKPDQRKQGPMSHPSQGQAPLRPERGPAPRPVKAPPGVKTAPPRKRIP